MIIVYSKTAMFSVAFNNSIWLLENQKSFGTSCHSLYFCSPFGLSYGVTVALQILVLSVKVRILIAQNTRTSGKFFHLSFFISAETRANTEH